MALSWAGLPPTIVVIPHRSDGARLTILDCGIPASVGKGGNSVAKNRSFRFRYLSVSYLLHALWVFVLLQFYYSYLH